MATKAPLHADKMFYALGPTGRYQCLHLIMASLGMLPVLIQLLDNVFIGTSVDHYCAAPQNISSWLPFYSRQGEAFSANVSITFDECHIRVKDVSGSILEEQSCPHGYNYDGPRSQSVVSELDLVCDKNQLLRVTQTLVFAGQVLGALVGPFFSDHFGRKPAMAYSNLGMLVLGMVIAFAPNYIVFAIAKFFIGALQQSVQIPMSIYTGELFPTEYRRFSLIINTVSWSMSGITMALVAFLMRGMSWRYLQAVLSLSSLGFIVQLWFMDESIVWLLANNKKKEAIQCVKRAARWNNKDVDTVLQAESGDLENASDDEKPSKPMLAETKTDNLDDRTTTDNGEEVITVEFEMEPVKLSIVHIFRVRHMLFNSVIMWVTWFSASLCYFTLYLMMSTLAGDIYLNYLLTSLMEIPVCFIFYFGFNRYGRRAVTIFLYSILAVGTCALGLLRHFTDADHGTWGVITLITSLLSLMGGVGCYFSLFFYLPELFPTNLRNQATGLASGIGRVGSMVSPFMGALATVAIWLPGLVMGVLSSIGVFLLFLLPETKDKELPQTLTEMESWYETGKSGQTKNQG